MKRITPLLFAAVVVVACTDDQPPTTSPFLSSPVLLEDPGIFDGTAEGGNDFFYWLPELVESPVITGSFNPEVPASIRICELGDDPNTASQEPTPPGDNPVCVTGTDVELFSPADISVTDTELSQQYSAVWKTDDPIAAPIGQIDPDKFYRLSVWVGEGEYGQELGYRYLDPEASPPSGSGAKLERFYPYKDGNTINIKFWVGAGAFCAGGDPANCGECFYSESGADDGNSDLVGRACTVPDETAGVFIDSETPEIDGVLIVVEYIPTDDIDGVTVGDGRTLRCYADPNNGGRVDFIDGLDIPQYGQCFVVTPICTRADGCPDYFDNTELNLQAIVGSCPLIPDDPDDPELHPVLHRTDDATNPTFVQALKPVSTEIPQDFLNCDPSFASLTPLEKLAWAWNKVSPFGATTAYADHRSLKGAEAPSFSDFVWAVPSQEEKAAGDNQVGFAGTTLPQPLTVQVTDKTPSAFWDGGRASESIGVPGAELTLAPAAGENWGTGGLSGLPGPDGVCGTADDAAISAPFLTDESGQFSACVRLPGAPGTYHVEASGYGIGVKEDWTSAYRYADQFSEWIATTSGTGPYSHFAETSTQCDPEPSSGLCLAGPITLPDPVAVSFEVTACEPGTGIATANGILGAGEYDCAESASFTANLSGGQWPATVFWMTSPTRDMLYMAVKIDRDGDAKANILSIFLDDDSDGRSLYDDVINIDGELTGTQQFSDEHLSADCKGKGQDFCGAEDGERDGEGYFEVNTANGETFWFYEIAKPLSNGDIQDAELSTFGLQFYLSLRYGSGNQGNTEWPGFAVYQQILP